MLRSGSFLLFIAFCLSRVVSGGTLAGFYSQGGGTLSMPTIEKGNFNKEEQQSFATQLFFYPLCDCQAAACVDGTAVLQALTAAWDAGSIPVLTLMPYPCSDPQTWIAQQIVNGTLDSQISKWGSIISAFLGTTNSTQNENKKAQIKRRLYVRPMHEMNGNWYPWGWTSDSATPPSVFKTAFTHLVDVLRSSSGSPPKTQMQIIWCINDRSLKNQWAVNPDVEQWYPGSDVVDWTGIDGYNTPSEVGGRWLNFSYIFDGPLANILSFASLPVAIPETGCDDGGNATIFPRKRQWLTEMCEYVGNHTAIKQLIYFNVEKEEQGNYHYWAVASTYYSKFKPYPDYYSQWLDCMIGDREAKWVFSNRTGMLVTDDQFLGK